VPEATDAGNKTFGLDRMMEALNQDPYTSPEDTLRNVHRAVNSFVAGAEQFDDLTMLCLEYKGAGEPIQAENDV
jgi:sigma-B regulation protein RsbU (phosphoserine phosphatase)